MKSTINTLLKPVYPDQKFENNLHTFLVKLNYKHERNRLFVRTAFSVVCLSTVVPAVILFIQDLGKSGFLSYLSLVISEHSQVFTYFKEISFSLIESIPVLSLAILLFALGAFMWSLILLSGSVVERRGFSRQVLQ